MPRKSDKQAADIEAAQEALRASIEATKRLASDAETLLKKREPSKPHVIRVPPDS